MHVGCAGSVAQRAQVARIFQVDAVDLGFVQRCAGERVRHRVSAAGWLMVCSVWCSWDEAFKDLLETLDVDGETHSYKVLGLESGCTLDEVTAYTFRLLDLKLCATTGQKGVSETGQVAPPRQRWRPGQDGRGHRSIRYAQEGICSKGKVSVTTTSTSWQKDKVFEVILLILKGGSLEPMKNQCCVRVIE